MNKSQGISVTKWKSKKTPSEKKQKLSRVAKQKQEVDPVLNTESEIQAWCSRKNKTDDVRDHMLAIHRGDKRRSDDRDYRCIDPVSGNPIPKRDRVPHSWRAPNVTPPRYWQIEPPGDVKPITLPPASLGRSCAPSPSPPPSPEFGFSPPMFTQRRPTNHVLQIQSIRKPQTTTLPVVPVASRLPETDSATPSKRTKKACEGHWQTAGQIGRRLPLRVVGVTPVPDAKGRLSPRLVPESKTVYDLEPGLEPGSRVGSAATPTIIIPDTDSGMSSDGTIPKTDTEDIGVESGDEFTSSIQSATSAFVTLLQKRTRDDRRNRSVRYKFPSGTIRVFYSKNHRTSRGAMKRRSIARRRFKRDAFAV